MSNREQSETDRQSNRFCRAALSNSYPNACVPVQIGSLFHFYDGLWYDPVGTRTHDLPCERRTLQYNNNLTLTVQQTVQQMKWRT